MLGLGFIELLVLLLVSALLVVPTWKICDKAGFPGWYGIAIAIPILNLVLLYYLSYAKWPALDNAQGTSQHAQVNSFDTPTEDLYTQPTDNQRAADMFKTARDLVKAGKKTEAVTTLKNLIQLFPNTEYAAKANKSLSGKTNAG
jgi:hypothetical protein